MTTIASADCQGSEDVYRDSVWRVTRVQPDRWVIERHGVAVARIRLDREEFKAEPELIEIAACVPAWRLLPVWMQSAIWRALLQILRWEESLPFDRPELHRLAVSTFRTRVDRAFQEGNRLLLGELVEDCPFWRMSRAELLTQPPCDLRLWHRLLRLPTDNDARTEIRRRIAMPAYRDFVKALRHAAGLIVATAHSEES